MDAAFVLNFWFAAENQPFWFEKSGEFDQKIVTHFMTIHHRAKQGELWSWRVTPEGRLAEIIILDQFSRNLFREQPQAFAQDSMALALAQEAISLKLDQQLDPVQRKFLYMPFMHSESGYIHDIALQLFQRLGDQLTLDFEKKHQRIIDRFGRYPHRNDILGRISTTEEQEFLTQPNSHF
ncbi:DUF924 domain-containing protein [Acinetobacter qingfengensis]|uniref:Uncharacterized protein n=1 Tax=Acinetobacter qingfengensis TaxID=1262585 RepID=A0A1E7R4T3_9GAMM|nr:DUF924 family protein [Acinetobacter qingfengensis]KAA8732384.1 DUF924 domain-containing protein [Acinetobacter qingfengensis]OEY94379.1 hypothetical protein BJI46_03290 [Acinetobacter qingfengensis]